MKTIPTNFITLLYTCPMCNMKTTQPLDEIVQNGTAVCLDCDCDMDLDDKVELTVTIV